MTFTRALARISSAYRTKYRIPLHPEFAFYGPLTDEMEQVLAKAYRLSENNEMQYRSACHQIIDQERAFLMEASDEQLDEVYGDGLWEDDKAILAHFCTTRSPIMVADLLEQSIKGLFDRSEGIQSKGGDVLDRPIDYRSQYE